MMLGTFLEDEDEIWFLEHLKKNPPAAVVWPGRKFDNMESRSIQHVAPRVTAWVRANYTPLPKQHRWFVMVPRPHLVRP